jgi:hypothetical protein
VQGHFHENALQDSEAKAEARIAEAEAIEAAIEAYALLDHSCCVVCF